MQHENSQTSMTRIGSTLGLVGSQLFNQDEMVDS